MTEHSNQVNQSSQQNHQPALKKHWYDRYYKLILLVPIILLILSIVYLASFYSTHGDIILKDATLAGGTTITLTGDIDNVLLEEALKERFPDVHTRRIADISTGEPIAVIVDTSASPEMLQPAIEEFLGYKLTSENSSIEFTGPTLGQNFYRQLVIAIIISFVLMSLVIFLLFKSFIPSLAVIFAVFADIVMTLALVDLFGIRISAAGIAAFLMLIGYSVDTDILLTNRVLKKGAGSVNQRIFSAFKTGIFMTITALIAVLPAFFLITGLPDSFRQIFLILAFGLGADIINTWLTNASMIKWYASARRGG